MKPRFEPSPPEATQAALDMAVQPFVEKFVRTDKRERATTLYLPKQAKASWHELIPMVDTQRARPCTPDALEPWDAGRTFMSFMETQTDPRRFYEAPPAKRQPTSAQPTAADAQSRKVDVARQTAGVDAVPPQ